MKNLLLLLGALAICPTVSLAQKPVLVSSSSWQYKNTYFEPVDSVAFRHLAGHNSTIFPLDNGIWDNEPYFGFDTTLHFTYQSGAYKPRWQFMRTFGTSNTITHEYTNAHSGITNTFVPYDRKFYHYNADNTLDTSVLELHELVSATWVPHTKYKYYYNAGKLVESLQWMWNTNTSAWVPAVRDSLFYDIAGRDSVFTRDQWMTGTGSWEEKNRTINVYDANGLKIRDTTIDNYYKWKGYGYDVDGHLVIDSSFVWSQGQGAWEYDGKYVYTYANDNHIATTRILWDKVNNVYINSTRQGYVYNPTDQVVAKTAEYWSNGVWAIPNYATFRFFHYEEVVSVPQLSSHEQRIKLYPVPAISHVQLDVSFNKAQDFAVIITDMQGRLVKQWKEPATHCYQKSIALTDMPTGNYVIQVRSATENYAQQLNVVK